jgi:hypothetical protein
MASGVRAVLHQPLRLACRRLGKQPTSDGHKHGSQGCHFELHAQDTLKRSPAISNTRALIDKVIDLMEPLGVESEVIRIVDYNIPFGVSSDEGDGDEWPAILAKLRGRR